jgi:hypothetical protein
MSTLSYFALGATLTASLPSMVQQISAPSNRGFLYALLNSSFAFYLFSYQGMPLDSTFYIFNRHNIRHD